MNIQNIATLALQLKSIGFDNMGYALLKRICLVPANFNISEKLIKEAGQASFNFYFEKESNDETYALLYYDAVLHRENLFTGITIDGINTRQTDEQMAQVDWKSVFDFTKRKSFNPDDKSSYETEVKIFQLISSLNKLEGCEEGKAISVLLKQKYWSEISYIDMMGAMTNGKSKSEVSQRFYFSEGQPVISADEAYRFLLNRWLEKQIQSKKKQPDNKGEVAAEEPGASSGSGLLKKRRIGSMKKNKSAQA